MTHEHSCEMSGSIREKHDKDGKIIKTSHCTHCEMEIGKITEKTNMKTIKRKIQKHVEHCLKNPSRNDCTDSCIFCGENVVPEETVLRLEKMKQHYDTCIMNPRRKIAKPKSKKKTWKTKTKIA